MVNRFFMDKLRWLGESLNWLQIGNKRNIIKRIDRNDRFGNYSRYPPPTSGPPRPREWDRTAHFVKGEFLVRHS
jgi:hypothetical protein